MINEMVETMKKDREMWSFVAQTFVSIFDTLHKLEKRMEVLEKVEK